MKTIWVKVLRSLSWALAALAYFGMPVFAIWAIQRDDAAQIAINGRPECGNALMEIMVVSFLAAGVLSLAASVLGAVVLLKLRRPRPLARILEWVALVIPLLISLSFMALGLF